MTMVEAAETEHETKDTDRWFVPLAFGAGTALVSVVGPLVVTMLVWATGGRSSAGLGQTLGIGVDAWLLGHGVRVGIGGAVVDFSPLLLMAAVLTLAAYGALRLTRLVGTDGPLWRGLVEEPLLRAYGLFVLGYAAVGAGAALLTLAGPARPSVLSAVLGLLLVPVAGCVAALARHARAVGEVSPFGVVRLPPTLRRAVLPGLWGAGVVLAAGAAVVVLAVVVGFGSVRHVSAELAPGALGGLLLWGAQLSALPNLGLWAVSFMSGSGFQVVDGATTSWSAAHSGLMPMVPVFGALPGPGAFPWVVRLVVLVPIALGWFIGQRALGQVARLSRVRTKAGVAAGAAVLSAVLLGLLDGLGGGSLGGYRLGDVGAPARWMTVLLAAQLCLGALARVGWDTWTLRRRR